MAKHFFYYLFFLCLTDKSLLAQNTRSDKCILNFFSKNIMNDSTGEHVDPRIGITLIGNIDTVSSFVNGEVIDTFLSRSNLSTIKIKHNNDLICIGLLKDVVVNIHDKLKKGTMIGKLPKKNSQTFLWIWIYQSGILLNKYDTYNYLVTSCQ